MKERLNKEGWKSPSKVTDKLMEGTPEELKNLFKTENDFFNLFSKYAHDLSIILNKKGDKEYLKELMPQALYNLLEMTHPNVSILACISYLEEKGFNVNKSNKED